MALINKMQAEPKVCDLFTKKEEYNPPFLDQYVLKFFYLWSFKSYKIA